mmetsp:Transcript_2258/g.2890  ORF Transcript_2258/g.2890 Transcript_2258/m.2890 type:complete len:243 (-) Transcript_2258:103-831(-)|eukprot:CAMPEP_0204823400 /NCGR_PEP_ID=MMETSP1346-20131115/1444_1 /ASSEMBLY_ACC=CAM_ASM_000771 /TAXON_ID=215587 /ORGANISM="Aplanochytrium stocchinoi, Strain GSBS06" /LENGTH=242 /DNA_ID=CAMNT_0051950009 /DNA_START=29 /DNA_END=757 /DNA_ORIENTATION=-
MASGRRNVALLVTVGLLLYLLHIRKKFQQSKDAKQKEQLIGLLQRVLKRIDALNAQDPRIDVDEGGRSYPKELLYGKRMTTCLNSFCPNSSDLLQIAARGQHIARWKSKRSDYPVGRSGYLKWRSDLYSFHGDILSSIMLEEGYEKAEADKIYYILSKKGIKSQEAAKRDYDSQTIEDVACLVFLKHYWKPFTSSQDDINEEKLINIVQRTWKKMSDKGHNAALKLDLPPEELKVINKALSQ